MIRDAALCAIFFDDKPSHYCVMGWPTIGLQVHKLARTESLLGNYCWTDIFFLITDRTMSVRDNNTCSGIYFVMGILCRVIISFSGTEAGYLVSLSHKRGWAWHHSPTWRPHAKLRQGWSRAGRYYNRYFHTCISVTRVKYSVFANVHLTIVFYLTMAHSEGVTWFRPVCVRTWRDCVTVS